MISLYLPLFLLATPELPASLSEQVEAIVTKTIAEKQTPGAVILAGKKGKIVYQKAFGKLTYAAEQPMRQDTIFDLASITKPVATATAIHQLLEQGKLHLSDPVAKHWPAFAAIGKEQVTIQHLLLHTSGLIADNSIQDYQGEAGQIFPNIAKLKLANPLDSKFVYSDVGFLVLGELVRLKTGKTIDVYTHDNIFNPLGMKDTGYTPQGDLIARCAPTSTRNGKSIQGVVHDPRAYYLQGVAGHAGLFGTATDLSIYAEMLLNQGMGKSARILSAESVQRMIQPVEVPGKAKRSLGWDVQSGFSSPAGSGFPAGEGFGHTGFTGTSIWIHPPSQSYLIILTNRVHPNDKGNVTPLRRELGTLLGKFLTEK